MLKINWISIELQIDYIVLYLSSIHNKKIESEYFSKNCQTI